MSNRRKAPRGRSPPKVDKRSRYAELGGGNLQVWGVDPSLEEEIRLRRRHHTGGAGPGGPVVVSNDLLLQDGSYLLLESGSKIVLEP